MNNQNNQIKHIPPNIGWYLAGFADGEGSFNVSVRKKEDYGIGWQITPTFNVSQKDPTILFLFKKHLRCGKIRKRYNGIMYYEVININSLYNAVIPFFKKFRLLSATKKKNFSVFKKIVEYMHQGKHLTPDGFKEILKLREKLNEGRGRKRKHNLKDILRLEN